jgi:hypothetical protein
VGSNSDHSIIDRAKLRRVVKNTHDGSWFSRLLPLVNIMSSMSQILPCQQRSLLEGLTRAPIEERAEGPVELRRGYMGIGFRILYDWSPTSMSALPF